jgi:putative restriction endonuclease
MTNVVFYHKADSQYDDQPDRFYHFPVQYLDRVQQAVGDSIVYYGTLPRLKSRYYFATARVAGIRADLNRAKHYYADIADYIDFDTPVDYRGNGGFEKRLISSDGKVSGGAAINAVRLIERQEFVNIVEAGLGKQEEWPDRNAGNASTDQIDGFAEDQTYPLRRPVLEQLVNRPFREAKFRQNIRTIYDRTCAFTGLRLINGSGRPEVEAAHIIPVENGGTDSVRNGIALSATAHWMFDRGMLSLSDEFKILVSRHLNEDVSHILNKDLSAKVPDDHKLQPHPAYLQWHRENSFKS